MSNINGFSSLDVNREIESPLGNKFKLEQIHQSLTKDRTLVGMMSTLGKWMSAISVGVALDASGHTQDYILITGNSIPVNDWIRFSTGSLVGVEAHVMAKDGDYLILGSKLPSVPTGADQITHLRPITPTVDLNGNISVVEGATRIVDFLDAGTLIPTGGSAIPASASAPLQVVASLAAHVTKIQSVSDVGEFINLYSDAGGVNLIGHLVLTPDEMIDVDLAAGTSLYMRSAKNAVIDDAGSVIQLNLIG